MTLFKIYKTICNHIGLEINKRSSNLKRGDLCGHLIIRNKMDDYENFADRVSSIYFKLNYMGLDLENLPIPISELELNRYPNLLVDYNTIISIMIISDNDIKNEDIISKLVKMILNN